MASGLQLSRADLLEAYRRMRLIREFEDRVHDEFAAGNIPASSISMPARKRRASASACISTTATRSPPPIAATAIASPRASTSTA